MADYDVIVNQTVDAFLLAYPAYNNTQFSQDRIFVSEGATLSQTVTEIEATLYSVDLTLGENSSGTAVLKQGYVNFTKPGFTLYMVPGIPEPADVVAPGAPELSTITATQDNTVLQGRTAVSLIWDPLLVSQSFGEPLGPATGSIQVIDLQYEPVLSSSEKVFEVTGTGAASTTLDDDFEETHDILRLVSAAGFSVGDLVYVDNGSDQRFYEIFDISGNDVTVTTECNLQGGFVAGSTVQQVTSVVKTSGVDYAMDYVFGNITLVTGQFAPGDEVVIIYTPMLQDLSHYELYRVNGNEPVSPSVGHTLITRDAVLSHPSVVAVDLNIADTALSYTDTLGSGENGETRTYYLFAADQETSANYSTAAYVMVETIPTIPQSPVVIVGDEKVEISWDALSVADENTDGFNIYRCDGTEFIPADCIRVNSTLIAKSTPYFNDSAENTLNRRSSGDVPYPVNGQVYTYKIESEDTVTAWTIGTKNADVETGPAQPVASKVP